MINLIEIKTWKTAAAQLLFVLSAIVACSGCTMPVTQRDRIIVIERESVFGIGVPASEVMMVFPKERLQREEVNIGGGTNNPRYFSFSDRSNSFILSGWFEPANRFTSVKSNFDEWYGQNAAAPSIKIREVEFKKVGKWDCVVYTSNLGSIERKHIRAHLVQDGTWIELHISVMMDAPSSALEFHKFLSTVNVIKIKSN